LEQVASKLEARLAEYEGVFDIISSYSEGSQEIKLRLKEDGRALGITTSELAAQVQHAFYGYEAQRILRGRDELRVMVRYPREERSSVNNLENMRIRTALGDQVPFDQVAELDTNIALSSILRIDRERTVNVTADIDVEVVRSDEVIQDVTNNFIPVLLKQHPKISFKLGGSSEEQNSLALRFLWFFCVALFLIYTLLAIPLRSYLQPLMVMAVIPFGFIGAIIGHIIFDTAITVMSLFGLVALAGVIVNDSLILVDFVNRGRREGMTVQDAVVYGGTHRFRAIFLTTLTTFFGLLPMMFETSMQAQLVIPMALSLAFGIVFGTALTLFMIPCLYLILDDFLKLLFKQPLEQSKKTLS
jgi:multidrug efflux pump subunit AcrB